MKRSVKGLIFGLVCLSLLGGVAKSASSYSAEPWKWGTTAITYNKSTLSSAWASAVWAGAFQWNAVTPSPFQWIAGDSGNNDVYLDSIDGQYGRLAETLVFGTSTVITRMTIRFDSAETWYTGGESPGSDLDAIGVAAHEFGHGLGLAHTQWWRCLSNAPTMCSSYNYGQTHFRNLEDDDKSGLNFQYP